MKNELRTQLLCRRFNNSSELDQQKLLFSSETGNGAETADKIQ